MKVSSFLSIIQMNLLTEGTYLAVGSVLIRGGDFFLSGLWQIPQDSGKRFCGESYWPQRHVFDVWQAAHDEHLTKEMSGNLQPICLKLFLAKFHSTIINSWFK